MPFSQHPLSNTKWYFIGHVNVPNTGLCNSGNSDLSHKVGSITIIIIFMLIQENQVMKELQLAQGGHWQNWNQAQVVWL